MVSADRISHAGYGAYELKATYQRNLLLSLLITALIAAGMASLTFLLQKVDKRPVVARPENTSRPIELGRQISITRSFVTPAGRRTAQQVRQGEIPEPVADSMFGDESPVILSTAEKAELVGSNDGAGENTGADWGQGVLSGYDDPWPDRDTFIPVERPPELIYSVTPEYPRLAKEAGIEGKVVIQALVSKEGDVLDAVVFVSSENTLLDAAALAVAWKYKYRPAIQNGRPLAIWVTYKVEFRLAH